ncbi:hypothetical protein PssvBMR4_gp60 [Pseudomonas phage MR4]|uniref:Uncharacterized protein n=1 Tax=Pseudomonas phage MR4 TaxID=2711171 RepID=A0A6M3TCM1_9CAUD|nr:hypothetical protein PssvBMR4_gp60 [Pseudomonas phage MR4]
MACCTRVIVRCCVYLSLVCCTTGSLWSSS